MPLTSEEHRARIGVFYPVMMRISEENWTKKKTRGRKRRQCAESEHFTSVTAGMTLSLMYCVCILLVLLCMDVETNPGPDDYHSILQILDWRFSQMMYSIQGFMADINRNLNEKFARIEENWRHLTEDITTLKTSVEEDRDNIRSLQEDRDRILQRLGQIEKEMNATETENRKNNLKFIGVKELAREDYAASIDHIVQVLNDCSRSETWQFSDIERVYRVGKRSQIHDHPRPLIVVFHRWTDKMKILQDQDIRHFLRNKNIRVTSDLTPQQRNEIEYYKLQGKKAYYRNGRLQVDDRPPHQNHYHYDQWPDLHSRPQEGKDYWKSRPRSLYTSGEDGEYRNERRHKYDKDFQSNQSLLKSSNSAEEKQRYPHGGNLPHHYHRHRDDRSWLQSGRSRLPNQDYQTAAQYPQEHGRRNRGYDGHYAPDQYCQTASQILEEHGRSHRGYDGHRAPEQDYHTRNRYLEEHAGNRRGYDGHRASDPHTDWSSSFPEDWGTLYGSDGYTDDAARYTNSSQGGTILAHDSSRQHSEGNSERGLVPVVPGYRLYSEVVRTDSTVDSGRASNQCPGGQRDASKLHRDSRTVRLSCSDSPDTQDDAGTREYTECAAEEQPAGTEGREETTTPGSQPSPANLEDQPGETDAPSDAVTTTAEQDDDHSRGETASGEDSAQETHNGHVHTISCESPSSVTGHPLSTDSGHDSASQNNTAGTSVFKSRLTSTNSDPTPPDDNRDDLQTDTDHNQRDKVGESPASVVNQPEARGRHVQRERSRPLRATAARKPRAISQSNIRDSFRKGTSACGKDSNDTQSQRQKHR